MKLFIVIMLPTVTMLHTVQAVHSKKNISTLTRPLYQLYQRSLTHRPINSQAMTAWNVSRQDYIDAHAEAVQKGLEQFTAQQKTSRSKIMQLGRNLLWAVVGASGVHLHENRDEYIKKYNAYMQKECK
jgi:hypothetical protein